MTPGFNSHQPVLCSEFLDLINIKPCGTYVDCTFGRGGHSNLILQQLNPQGKLFAFDRDPSAFLYGKKTLGHDLRFKIINSEFSKINSFLGDFQDKIDGIFVDLGISSPQVDNPSRGFSFSGDGPLDMRMNPTHGMSAGEWLRSAPEKVIADVIWRYGEERNSRRIAREIVKRREQERLNTTSDLAATTLYSRRKNSRTHSATKTFQAIRIFINDEMTELNSVLEEAVKMVAIGGKIVVISFHSLEDRLVKRKFRDLSKGKPNKTERYFSLVTKKPIMASREEISSNKRSRSARMRVLERLS